MNERLRSSEGWRGVSLIKYESENAAKRHQSGFFIAPDVFVTALSPKSSGFNCDSAKIILINSFLNPNDTDDPIDCEAVLYLNPKQGIVVMRTRRPSQIYLELRSDKGLFKKSTKNPEPIKISALGISEEEVPFFADACEIERATCQFCNALSIEENSWTEAKCLVRSGMAGSPVLLWEDNQWRAMGFLGTIVPKVGAEKNSEVTSVVRFSEFDRIINLTK
jgi:hypothetical protein